MKKFNCRSAEAGNIVREDMYNSGSVEAEDILVLDGSLENKSASTPG